MGKSKTPLQQMWAQWRRIQPGDTYYSEAGLSPREKPRRRPKPPKVRGPKIPKSKYEK